MSTRETPKRRLTRLLGLLAVTVMLPSIAVLWVLGHAVSTEQAALEQRFQSFCQDQLHEGARRWDRRWRMAEAHWLEYAQSQAYHNLVTEPLFVAAVILHEETGLPVFPLTSDEAQTETPDASPVRRSHSLWPQARWLELRNSAYPEAAKLYAEIANQATGTRESALAWQSQLRCLVKSGEPTNALELWHQRSQESDQTSPALWDAALYLVQHLETPASQELGKRVRDWLHKPHADSTTYGRPPSIAKRLMMMQELEEVGVPCPSRLAEQRLASLPAEALRPPDETLTLSPTVDGLWKILAPDRRSLVFLEEAAIQQVFRGQTVQSNPHADAKNSPIILEAPGSQDGSAFLTHTLTSPLRGWRVTMNLGSTANPFAESSRRATHLAIWIASLAVAAAFVVGLWLSRAILHEAKLNRLKNDFLAAVSHELKTPVTAIGLLVDHLQRKDAEDTQETREYLALITKENDRLGRLIDNFLSFSRMERHKQSFARESVSLQEVVDDAASIIRDRYPVAAQRLVEEEDPSKPLYLEGDRDALTTVIVNLIDNAIKYSKDEVRLDLEATGDQAFLSVSDRGIGMNAEEQRQAFQKFYRADPSLASETSGVGLGLSIVQFIVRAHRGSVSIQSEPGKGSRFTVALPLTSGRPGQALTATTS